MEVRRPGLWAPAKTNAICTVFTKVVRSQYFIPSPQSAFYTLSVFYTQSVFSSPRFIPSPYFIPSPQSVVRSPQSVFYTDRFQIILAHHEVFVSHSARFTREAIDY